MRHATVVVLAMLLWLQAGRVPAFNTLFADQLPIGRMNQEDIELLLAAVDDTLERAADGSTREWRNPKTGAGGYLTPRASYRDAGLRCRDLAVENRAGGMHNRATLSVCKQPDGSWKVKP